ncbi:hypothetical protein GC174_17585 [bacterium]|nr:hypothetical protein [bacterium]
MKAPERVVIFHPAAIGDSMLATPVARTLRKNFPDTKITYWSHGSLEKILLDFCPAVDNFETYQKDAGLISHMKNLSSLAPDLFVDLSNSTRGKILGLFATIKGARVCSYRKQRASGEKTLHAVDNFVESIKDIVVDRPDNYFPSIFPDSKTLAAVEEKIGRTAGSTILGIVPGVGQLRPHRGWSLDNWLSVLNHFQSQKNIHCILIGGPEEAPAGEYLEKNLNSNPKKLTNLCGKLDLKETAAALKHCQVVVSCDTGPAHIACTVGTPVIGLYGPTLLERSGPYGNNLLALTTTASCQCLTEKCCRFKKTTEPGLCMDQILPDSVIKRIESILPKTT